MTARAWGRLSVAPWVVYAVAFAAWAAVAFSRGLIGAACVAALAAAIGVVMTARQYRQHRRLMREHEARLAAIREDARQLAAFERFLAGQQYALYN